MSTFSLLLLAWPFYLAVHGRLADYVALAKPSQAPASATASNNQASLNEGLSMLSSMESGNTEGTT